MANNATSDTPWYQPNATARPSRYTINALSKEAQARAYKDWCARYDAPFEVFLVDCAANGYLFTALGNLVHSETKRTL